MINYRYFEALNGVRAIAALWVLLYHLHPALRAFYGHFPGWPIIATGYQGVDLFFVLSGFLVAHHHMAEFKQFNWQKYIYFLIGRLIKLYPLHLMTLLLVWIMVWCAPNMGITINHSDDYSWRLFIKNIFLIQAWDIHARVSWNHFAWSISAQWLCYVLTPAFILIFNQIQHRYLLYVMLGICVLIAPSVYAVSMETRPSAYALFRVLGAFGAGMIGYQLFSYRVTMRASIAPWVMMIVAIWVQYYMSSIEFLTVPFALMLIIYSAKHNTSGLLRMKSVQYVGRISYALYITQFLVIMPIKKILPFEQLIDRSSWVQSFYFVTMIVIIGVVAMIAHHRVEIPVMHYLKQRFPNTKKGS
jgi:peptidoglycan/LPS O-acetylase OafA/YrhL